MIDGILHGSQRKEIPLDVKPRLFLLVVVRSYFYVRERILQGGGIRKKKKKGEKCIQYRAPHFRLCADSTPAEKLASRGGRMENARCSDGHAYVPDILASAK